MVDKLAMNSLIDGIIFTITTILPSTKLLYLKIISPPWFR